MRLLSCIGLLCSILGFSRACLCEETARVVLISEKGAEPSAKEVSAHLQTQLDRVEVRGDQVEVDGLPGATEEWLEQGRKLSSKVPGTLAVFGWECTEGKDPSCTLYVVDTETSSLVVVPVELEPDEEEEPPSTAFAVAAVIRECVWGGLPVVLGRLVQEGKHPRVPPSPLHRSPKVLSEDKREGVLGREGLPWIWFEGGYRGEYPYPEGRTIHGPWLGIALSPGKRLVPVLTFGWLGKRDGESEIGEASSHRFPLSLSVRLVFPVGHALFSIAPVGRVDLVFSESNPYGPRGSTSETDVELHVGGETYWHLPLPEGKVEILLGVGILGTILGNDYGVDDTVAISASELRVLWTAGIAWTPVGD